MAGHRFIVQHAKNNYLKFFQSQIRHLFKTKYYMVL